MEGKKAVATVGLLASVAGIMISLFFYFTVSGLIADMADSSLDQVDNVISLVNDEKGVASSAALSVDYLSDSISGSSESVRYTADALGGMGTSVNGIASGLAGIPLMPAQAVAPLYDTATGISTAADSLSDAADSLEESGTQMGGVSSGLYSFEGGMGEAVEDLQRIRGDIEMLFLSAGLALLLETIVMVLLFGVNALSFYMQMK